VTPSPGAGPQIRFCAQNFFSSKAAKTRNRNYGGLTPRKKISLPRSFRLLVERNDPEKTSVLGFSMGDSIIARALRIARRNEIRVDVSKRLPRQEISPSQFLFVRPRPEKPFRSLMTLPGSPSCKATLYCAYYALHAACAATGVRPPAKGRLRLPAAPSRAVDLSGGIAGIVRRELHIDGCQFRRLAWPTIGVWPPNCFSFSWVAPPLTCSGVQIGPGATPFTRMPFEASCFASDLT